MVPKPPSIALLGLASGYASVYAMLIPIARAHGYALAVHGTMNRDLDLIAVPWTEQATDALPLILAIKEATKTCTHSFTDDHYWPDCAPTIKPFGRRAYSLHFTERGGDGPYIDISVLPKQPVNAPAQGDLLP